VSEFHVEVGAYALDALDESEREAFEQHLASCRSCQRELAEFTETTARLGVLGDVAPPAELRGSLLDAIRQVRPLPPLDVPSTTEPAGQHPELVAAEAAGAVPDPEAPRPAREGEPKRALEPAPEVDSTQDRDLEDIRGREHSDAGAWSGDRSGDGSSEASDELERRRLKRQGRRSRLLTLAVAAVTVIALAFGGWAYVLQRQQQTVASQAAAANQLLSAPDVRTYPVSVGGTPATFVVSKSLDKAMFVGADLPAAAQGRTYQLWTLDSTKTPKPAETFPGGPDTAVFMTGDITDAAALAVTNEPEGGSAKPTLPTLASTAL
jgi:anti-sigma-K factor RskA